MVIVTAYLRTKHKTETKFKQNDFVKELKTQTIGKYGRVCQIDEGEKGQVLGRQVERLDVVVSKVWTDDELSQATHTRWIGTGQTGTGLICTTRWSNLNKIKSMAE
ncbi:hypothetical protein SNK03_001750 [Fusarium graminearum]